MTSETSNAGQIDFWNGRVGDMWTLEWEHNDRMHAQLAARSMAVAAFGTGERVIDVGCGCGSSTFEIADAIGPEGTVTAIDVSHPMLEVARGREASIDARNIEFIEADASFHPFPESAADVVYSRFGVMFFHNTQKAFANFARALRPGGRLTFVCWRRFELNDWVAVPHRAACALEAIPSPWNPDTPGPFAMCDDERIRAVLQAAGFSNISIEPFDAPLMLGETQETACRKITKTSPISAGLAAVDPDRRDAVRDAVATSIAPFASKDGVEMGGAVWITTARR